MTQLESTTSTVLGGERDRFDVALEPVHVLDAGLGLVGAGEVEHLVGHVEAVGGAGRADAAGGEQDVDAAAGAEVEHGLAGVRSAIAVGLPQPSEASSASSGSSSRSSP